MPMRLLLLWAVCVAVAAADVGGDAEEEFFRLADGRTFTGIYDAERQQLSFQSGRISGAVTVAPEEIVERRPVDQAPSATGAAPVADDGLEDLLVLHDGRELQGHYDAEAGVIALSGAIVASIPVAPDEILERRRVPVGSGAPSAEPEADQQTKRRIWLSDQLAQAQQRRRQTEADLVLLGDGLRTTITALAAARDRATAVARARTAAERAYRQLLQERDDFVAAHPNSEVPEELSQRVADAHALFRRVRLDSVAAEAEAAQQQAERSRLRQRQAELQAAQRMHQAEIDRFQGLLDTAAVDQSE